MSLLGALSAIGEVVVSKFFDFALEKLASSEFWQFATEKQIQAELQKLTKELLEIRALLDDAEERQLKDQSVKLWLSDLQNLAYDVDDIVDEIQTEISWRNLMFERRGSSSKKPRLISDSFNVVKSNKGMMSKIKDITAKLKELEPRKNQLQLKMNDSQKANRIEERVQPTSVRTDTHVYGRDKDKEAIFESVFKSDDEGNFVIPIVGMGGIGKTTLAQLVYNDDAIQKHFDFRGWACVSDDFDVRRITKAILQGDTSEPCRDNDLNSLQEKLEKKLSGKKFLIVLDDVWNEDYHKWTIFQSPFLTRTPGSKIIVTTRSLAVSSTMGASHAHSLEVLSEDDCLSVFAQHAVGARDFGGHPNLKEVAEKIVRKCKGLPLAAKTLGGLLRTNVDYDAWKKILESEIWKLSDHRYDIIPALQLSYHHLPPHLKRCFAYCSIIPKDYEFKEREVILLWRAEGFLQEARDKHSVEDLGHEYFRDLVSRSLLQISNKDGSPFVMHDLINDLAQSVAGEICFKIEGDQKISKHARHLSYIAGNFDGMKRFKGISEVQGLRTFLSSSLFNDDGWHSVANDVLTYLLPKLRCLRVLSLRSYTITELPDFFEDLKHLRYLDFSYTAIKCLPKSINTLYNLETLLLGYCEQLVELPSEMENLVNLCYLDVRGTFGLEGMLSNFGTLTGLQTLLLSQFDLDEGHGCQIKKLEGLSNLKGEFCISGLKNVVEPQDAWKAKLHDKSGLDKLTLMGSLDPENRTGEIEKDVLDLLQPSKKLKELALKNYCGVRFAEWIGDSSFTNLLSLILEYCPNCTSLPSIGQLPLLKNVRVSGLHSVTVVGVEFFGMNASNAFPKLESLEFEDMPEWEKWNFCEVDEEARKFPSLRELCIKSCPKLLGSMPEYLPSLEKLVILGCGKLVITIQSFPMLSELEIAQCQKVVLRSLKGIANDRSLKGIANDRSLKEVSFSDIPEFTCAVELTLGSIKVESLHISDCGELCSFQKNNWGLLTQSMSLGKLKIANWRQLVSVGAEEEREESMQLKIPRSIQNLTIDSCVSLKKLSTLHDVTSLTGMVLDNCPALISLSKNNLPLNLKTLVIYRCKNLKCLFEEGENVGISNARLLELLLIWDCPSLVSLSSRGELPTGLKQLKIFDCPKLESIAQEIQDNSSLEFIRIEGCSNLKYLPQGLNKISHLRRLYMDFCSNLVSFPENGLPTSNLKVLRLRSCGKLQALPHGIHNLNCLEELGLITDCSSLTSFPEEGIPTNLRELSIGGNICKPLMEWGLHRLTSLKSLRISEGFPDAVTFPLEEIGMVLPCSLTSLQIENFPKLEILSSKGFRRLTSLEQLCIENCPNLKSLPEKDTLSSLLQLNIEECPMLKERCENDKRPEWSKITHVPCVQI